MDSWSFFKKWFAVMAVATFYTAIVAPNNGAALVFVDLVGLLYLYFKTRKKTL